MRAKLIALDGLEKIMHISRIVNHIEIPQFKPLVVTQDTREVVNEPTNTRKFYYEGMNENTAIYREI